MNPDFPTPNATADEVAVVGDAEIVNGGNCFGRAVRCGCGKSLYMFRATAYLCGKTLIAERWHAKAWDVSPR